MQMKPRQNYLSWKFLSCNNSFKLEMLLRSVSIFADNLHNITIFTSKALSFSRLRHFSVLGGQVSLSLSSLSLSPVSPVSLSLQFLSLQSLSLSSLSLQSLSLSLSLSPVSLSSLSLSLSLYITISIYLSEQPKYDENVCAISADSAFLAINSFVLICLLQGSASATASSAATPPVVNTSSNAPPASVRQAGSAPGIAPSVTSSVSATPANASPAAAVSIAATMQGGMPPAGPGMSSDRSGQTRDAGATHTGSSDRHTGPVQAANLPAGCPYAGERKRVSGYMWGGQDPEAIQVWVLAGTKSVFCVHACICECMCLCADVHRCVCVCARMCVYVHECTHLCRHGPQTCVAATR